MYLTSWNGIWNYQSNEIVLEDWGILSYIFPRIESNHPLLKYYSERSLIVETSRYSFEETLTRID